MSSNQAGTVTLGNGQTVSEDVRRHVRDMFRVHEWPPGKIVEMMQKGRPDSADNPDLPTVNAILKHDGLL